MTQYRGHAAPGIKQKAISVWLIPTKYVNQKDGNNNKKRFCSVQNIVVVQVLVGGRVTGCVFEKVAQNVAKPSFLSKVIHNWYRENQ
jgi:prolipoprotein diacylglyceryltransferase